MKNILIIEDDQTVSSQLKIFLEKYDYSVTVAIDFEKASSLALNGDFHLVLLDINLPVYDGYHVCRQIRASSSLPIIVITSRDNDMDELMSMNLGADDFVPKPFNTQVLLARIESLLRRSYSTSDELLIAFNDVTLDRGKSLLLYNDRQISLTKNEMGIMLALIKAKENIVSRDEIMKQLWQSNEFIDDNTLTVNINRLRKKTDELGLSDFIKTQRGQGYHL